MIWPNGWWRSTGGRGFPTPHPVTRYVLDRVSARSATAQAEAVVASVATHRRLRLSASPRADGSGQATIEWWLSTHQVAMEAVPWLARAIHLRTRRWRACPGRCAMWFKHRVVMARLSSPSKLPKNCWSVTRSFGLISPNPQSRTSMCYGKLSSSTRWRLRTRSSSGSGRRSTSTMTSRSWSCTARHRITIVWLRCIVSTRSTSSSPFAETNLPHWQRSDAATRNEKRRLTIRRCCSIESWEGWLTASSRSWRSSTTASMSSKTTSS